MGIVIKREHMISHIDYGEVFEQKRAELRRAIQVLEKTDQSEDGLFMYDGDVLSISVIAANGGVEDMEQWLIVGGGTEIYKIIQADEDHEAYARAIVRGNKLEDCNDLGRVVQAVQARIPVGSDAGSYFIAESLQPTVRAVDDKNSHMLDVTEQ